jgi:hypothetical protein
MNMSRLLRRLPTLYRTLRSLRFDQARAQVRHAIFGLPAPVRLPAADYRLTTPSGVTSFLPPPAHVRSRGSRRVEFLATEADFTSGIDWQMSEHGPLFAYHLHQHEYLRTESFSARERVEVLLDWIEKETRGIGWNPHPISLRLLCWGKLLLSPDALEGVSPAARSVLLRSLADQAESLSRGLEVRLQANHLFSNLLAVVWAGLLIEPDDSKTGAPASDPTRSWLALAPRFGEELARQILPDGGHEERSPMYHALLLENVLDLLNLAGRVPERVPAGLLEQLEDVAERMLLALDVFSHPDGRIALFSDSGFDIAAEPDALIDYARRLGLDPHRRAGARARSVVLPAAGYVRLVAPDVSLLASTSGPAPAHQPGHAHCDALAFELCLAGRRVVTDTGLFEYRPGPRRDHARATRSHSTLEIDGQEQAEVWSAHRVGGRPRVALEGWDGESMAEARCAGWSRRTTLHRRTFRVAPGEAEIIDRLEGPASKIHFALPFDPDWTIKLAPDGLHATARSVDSKTVRAGGEVGAENDRSPAGEVEVSLPGELAWRVDRAAYYPSFGREVERDVLVGEGPPFREARTLFVWKSAPQPAADPD